MTKRTITFLALIMLTTGMFALALPVRPTEASAAIIYIRGDGSVGPSDAPISTLDNVTYTFDDNINGSLVVRRSNIVVDGSGYTLQGTGGGVGITLDERTNVTIKNLTIRSFYRGIILDRTSSSNITGNNILEHTQKGIRLQGACDNQVSRNNIMANVVVGIICSNGSMGNEIYHNTYVGNAQHASSYDTSLNVWDAGYPRGGNYWGDYSGNDLFRGMHQNVTGADGIGDVPYSIRGAEGDNYPLMGTFPSIMPGQNVTVFQDPEVGLIFNTVTAAGLVELARTLTGPPCVPDDFLVGSFYNITVTAGFSGGVIVRIIYDDFNLTQEQEASLRVI